MMTGLETRINGSAELAGLPTGIDRPLVLENMDSPTAFTPTVCAMGLLVNLAYLQGVAQLVTSRFLAL